MEQPWLMQFALAGAAVFFAVHIIKTILPLLPLGGQSARPSQQSAGDQSVDFWTTRTREGIRDTLSQSVIPILERQTAILSKLESLAAGEESQHLRLQISADELRDGQSKLRDGMHRANEHLQVIAGRLSPPIG